MRSGLTRREFLSLAAMAAVAGCERRDSPTLPSPGATATEPKPSSPVESPDLAAWPFALGVASGDPLPDRVVIWTRLAYPGEIPQPPPGVAVPLTWEMAEDEDFRAVVASGRTLARPELAHAVHVDVGGLGSDRWYWYRFAAGEHVSPVGRTRTLPPLDSSPERLRFALAYGQNWEDGYFNPYHHLAREQLNFVLFVGDYIYARGRGGVRRHKPVRLGSLESYRNHYALYKSDPGLQAAHAAFPWIVTWDDHEFRNNYAGFVADPSAPTNRRRLRERAAAYRAFYENVPMRATPPEGPHFRIYRDLHFGDLASFFVLDTRQYRTPNPCGSGVGRPCPDLPDASGSVLGPEQEAWLRAGLGASRALWTVLAQQVPMISTGTEELVNFDQWDGYPVQRAGILAALARESVRNPVVLSGDIHAAGVGDLHLDPRDPRSPLVATEFIGPSISSGSDKQPGTRFERSIQALEPVRYFNWHQRGYARCEVTRREWRTDFRLVESVRTPEAPISTASSWRIEVDRPGALPVGS